MLRFGVNTPLAGRHACGRRVGRAARATLVLALLFAPALAPNASAAAGEAVIPGGQEDLLAEVMGRGEALAGCKFAAGEVDHSIIKATYACPGGEVVFELRHPSKASAGATKTARFAMTLVSGSPPAGLVDALAARIRSRETAFEWKVLEPPRQGSPGLSIGEPVPVLLAAAGILGLAVLGWALRRRRLARPTQLP